ncbi:MAG: sulfatase-like hydrolase/transferase [Alphaproteobacteria bacterium]
MTCTGHPHLETPHIDGLAKRGVNFTRAFVQSPLCGPSRISCLTSRYVHSHGATSNDVPLSVSQPNIGDWLRSNELRCALAGKTRMAADLEGMKRLGVDPVSDIGILTSEAGLEPVERDDGLWPNQLVDPNYAYN